MQDVTPPDGTDAQKWMCWSVVQVKTALAAVVRPEEVVGRSEAGGASQETDRNAEDMLAILKGIKAAQAGLEMVRFQFSDTCA